MQRFSELHFFSVFLAAEATLGSPLFFVDRSGFKSLIGKHTHPCKNLAEFFSVVCQCIARCNILVVGFSF
jgi:hypothetical protein